MENMKMLVTGGCGFIGSNLVDELIKQGNEVIVIDNLSSECHEQFYFNPKAKYYHLDICSKGIKRLFKNVDTVFHLAAESRIQPTIDNPPKACLTNFVGTCNILQCARENRVRRVVFSSSSSVYGLNNQPPLKEDMKPDPLNPYSVSKLGGEGLCKNYSDLFGLETVVLRYFNVYGNREPIKGQYAPVIGLFKKQKEKGEPMTIVGDGLQTRDYTNVKDVVRANILASQIKEANGQVFNIGTGRSFSVMDLVKIIGGDYVHIPPRQGEARCTLADNSKAKEILGWSPTVSLEDYLK